MRRNKKKEFYRESLTNLYIPPPPPPPPKDYQAIRVSFEYAARCIDFGLDHQLMSLESMKKTIDLCINNLKNKKEKNESI